MEASPPPPGDLVRGDISWQQGAGRPRRAAQHVAGTLAVRAQVPATVGPGELRRRLERMMLREDVLRIVEMSFADGGHVLYAPAVDVPFSEHSAGSADALEEIRAEVLGRTFPLSGGPMWAAAAVEHAHPDGRRERSVFAVFDHLVTDARGGHVFREELTSEEDALAGGQRGRYRDWVAWQRQHFPLDPGAPTPAREFWLRYLDGTLPDRHTPLPFFPEPEAPLTGVARNVYRELPVTTEMLQAASGRLWSSPFVVLLAALTVTVGRAAQVGDVTFRVMKSGRTLEYMDTIGLFSDPMPVRIRHPALADRDHALAAASAGWLDTLEHQLTPWDYVMAVCTGTSEPPSVLRPAGIEVNFQPYPSSGLTPRVETAPRELGRLQLMIVPDHAGRLYVISKSDPGRFGPAGVDQLLDAFAAELSAYAEEP